MNQEQADIEWMKCALDLARKGLGRVEPNPMVGCVLVKDSQIIGQGYHQEFGGAHAEVNAIADANQSVSGCTAYVTLEPCAHTGKTPPCVNALIQAGARRVVIAHPDPNPLVAGGGIKRLRNAGIQVEVGLLHSEAESLLAPFLKRITSGMPWIIAKWAMTWDGKIASANGDSQWISNEKSRQIVHQIRGRVDGIMVGVNTVLMDNPLLTARPPGQRLATRIVLDTQARISLDSQLCQSAHRIPTLIAVGPQAELRKIQALKQSGCDVWQADPSQALTANISTSVAKEPNPDQRKEPVVQLQHLMRELSKRGMTNLLVEGGSRLLGSLFDLQQIDEVHIFIGAKLLGGKDALTPIAGVGAQNMLDGQSIELQQVTQLDNDVYLVGRTRHTNPA
jgi:diaminohydroxyphosphoribosylaminopyrimidine deaminase / 5-amino-6-(5-phosphoribosylamino)uracil reductase